MADPTKLAPAETTRVGYRNPPTTTRFRKGRSGNPSGRPKGTLNLATVLERTLRERVVVNEHGKQKSITKLEAAIKQLSNKAASGDLKALGLLASLVRSAEERAVRAPTENSDFKEADEKVFLNILNRLEAANKEAKDDGTKDQ